MSQELLSIDTLLINICTIMGQLQAGFLLFSFDYSYSMEIYLNGGINPNIASTERSINDRYTE